MALVPGERLGSYEIVSLLGAGGMGVVYRARDAHLQRTVALKVLSEDRETPDTSELLLHEARAASALNHPNICTIHEVREEAGRVFIVMEYVDGRPLSQLVPVGGLANESVLRYGIQIADALGHAHDHGVLHRDLKSANVIVTREGRTKIVDFGLARRFGQPAARIHPSGILRGRQTVANSSSCAARAASPARSGSRAPTAAARRAGCPPIRRRSSATSRCFRPTAGGSSTPRTAAGRRTSGPRPSTEALRSVSRAVRARTNNMRTAAARTLVRHSPFLWAPSFAPTGRMLAYSRSEVDGSWHIWITDVDAGAPRRLTTSDRGEVYPRWTPDGRFVLFQNWSPPRRIWRVAPDGGPPVPLTAENRDASYADVSPDGRQLAFVITDAPQERVYVMSITGDEGPRLLRDGPASLPRWSPDGAWIAFAPNRGYFGGILIVRPDGTGERRLTDSGGWPVWWPDGTRISYVTVRPDASQQIQTVTLDGAISIPPVPIRFSSVNDPFDIARDGELLVTTNAVHVSSEIWVLQPGP